MVCCCSLAGTHACESCNNRPMKPQSHTFNEYFDLNGYKDVHVQRAFNVRRKLENKLLRQQIEDAILDGCFVGKDGIDCDKAVDGIMKIMEEN